MQSEVCVVSGKRGWLPPFSRVPHDSPFSDRVERVASRGGLGSLSKRSTRAYPVWVPPSHSQPR